MDRSSLEVLLGRGLSLREVGLRLGRHESTVAYWVAKHGLRAANAERHAARGGLERDLLEALIDEGATIAEIARRAGRSPTTVRHWLVRHGLKTAGGGGRRPRLGATVAKRAGLATATMICPTHGETEFWLDGRGHYRCRLCRGEAVTRRRRRVKRVLVDEAGGACAICGYRRCMRALEFHHVDPLNKRFEMNAKGVAVSLERLQEEARKCVLLCSNCHAEVEAGMAAVPGLPVEA